VTSARMCDEPARHTRQGCSILIARL
jgi:hypothetical protein